MFKAAIKSIITVLCTIPQQQNVHVNVLLICRSMIKYVGNYVDKLNKLIGLSKYFTEQIIESLDYPKNIFNQLLRGAN